MLHDEKTRKSDNLLDEFSEFPIPTYEEWRRITEKSLKGASFDKLITKTYEGIELQPMYQSADIKQLSHVNTAPGQLPYLRGTKQADMNKNKWGVSQEIKEPIPEQFNKVARESLAKGQTVLHLVLDEATIDGVDADMANPEQIGQEGVSLSTLVDLHRVFEGIDLSTTPIYIETGSLSLPFMSQFFAYVQKQNYALDKIEGCIGMDPLGELVEKGSIPFSLDTCYNSMAEAAKWIDRNNTSLKTILVKGHPYHNGGASAVEELAYSLATAVEYIRELQKQEVSIDVAASQIYFSFSIGSNVFMEIAKIRAARILWSKIIEAFGGNETSQKMTIHARTSSWNKTIFDPYVNMLRTTAEAFSAAIGGVDSLHVSPFDEAIQTPTSFSRRIARNTQLILQEESHLAKIIDPAGGSWYIEKLTDEVAKSAWKLFQETEAAGGMREALKQNLPQETIAKTSEKRKKNIEHCRDVFVGINRYANATEEVLKSSSANSQDIGQIRIEAVQEFRVRNSIEKELTISQNENLLEQLVNDVVAGNRTIGDLASFFSKGAGNDCIIPIKKERGAEPFEQLRRATEKVVNKTGERPKVFLANMGPIASYKPRSDFASGFFEIGGFLVDRNNGFDSIADVLNAFLASKTDTVVICLKDENNSELVLPLIRKIKSEQPRTKIFLAGLPTETNQSVYKEAGLTDFVHVRSNCYQVLTHLMEEKGMI